MFAIHELNTVKNGYSVQTTSHFLHTGKMSSAESSTGLTNINWSQNNWICINKDHFKLGS